MEHSYEVSAEIYDALYSWKDYAAETARLVELLEARRGRRGRLLDVACGTGKHLSLMRERFDCEGLDIDPRFVTIASERNPGVLIHQGDFCDFNLGKRFDAVTCLFSAIGYAVGRLDDAIAAMARHLNPEGVLLVEPWFTPEQWHSGTLHSLFIDQPELKIARINLSMTQGNLSVMDMHHLVGTPEGVRHFIEHHEMQLFTHEEYMDAFRRAGLEVRFDERGLMGRGLYIGVAPS